MQAASGGPLRIKFTPEQIAQFESYATRVPGMNNSGGNRYREEGVQAQQHQEQEAKRKEEEIKSRMEMRPTLKRKATTTEKLRGKKDEYVQTPQVIGMSGADPAGEFILAGIGLNGIGTLAKTGLWNVAKYTPRTQLGNYGRNYFVNNSFKNSFNGNVPKLVVNPQTRTRVGDVEIDNPNLLYHLDRGDGAGAFSNQGAYVENGFLFPGTPKDSSTTPYSWWNKGKPYATNVDGQPMTRLMTATENTPGMLHVRSQNYPIGQWNGRRGFVLNSEYVNPEGVNVLGSLYNWKPGYGYKKITQEPSTSLAFFERKPSKITEAEKFGLNKHDRKLLSENEQQALQDLAQYKNSGQYRQVFRVTPDWENFGWNLDRSNPTFMQQFAKEGKSMRGPWARVTIQSPTGKGALAVNPEKNMAGYTSRSFPVPEGMDWTPGEANMMIEGTNGQKLILTAPKTDFFDAIVEKGSESIGEKLSNIIDKNVMKDFWINSRKAQRPGTYLSGDNATLPKGSDLIEAFRKRQLYKTSVKERPLAEQFTTRTGLSSDSYSSIIRQGMRDGSLRWGEGFEKWNNSAIQNKYIFDSWQKMQKGEISIPEYERIFNSWSQSIGGKPLQIFERNGNVHIIHPHPYIFSQKQGGKMNIIEFLKKGSGIHIKKKNRGKFTSYCGGKVTDECIRKAKASGNPTLVKRATFAQNSRRWSKHKNGGQIIQQFKMHRLLSNLIK